MELIIISRPIKKSLLIHTVDYIQSGVDDDLGWGDETGAPATINNVRIEPKEVSTQDANGAVITSNTTLFWDNEHSTEVEFKQNGKIVWNNKTFYIKQIDEFYDDKKLHHIELRLI